MLLPLCCCGAPRNVSMGENGELLLEDTLELPGDSPNDDDAERALLSGVDESLSVVTAEEAWLAVPLVAECRLRVEGGHDAAEPSDEGFEGAKGEWPRNRRD